ncbi:MAG TPA: DUF1599 domain-containing protein [Bacteroidales bacterium]|nr:DUF1599 domain-containing protein [Bacteroidales bacterium]HSA43796.1 DUF1599 domain-containing protein [Bacteroidales bacterium]
MDKTNLEFDAVTEYCRAIFCQKLKDYGASWRVLRPSSLTDQLYIKVQRIRGILDKGVHRIAEGIKPEFAGLVNYSLIALIQIEQGWEDHLSPPDETVTAWYDAQLAAARELMQNKNHDYGEAWRDMRISSLADIILMKLMRIKQIEDNRGRTFVSEGVEANYLDIVNYAAFALIMILDEEKA